MCISIMKYLCVMTFIRLLMMMTIFEYFALTEHISCSLRMRCLFVYRRKWNTNLRAGGPKFV